MNPSNLQQQYPLSPRKFWKKIISNSIGYGILSLVFGGGIGLVVSILSSGGDLTSPALGIFFALLGFILVFAFSFGLYAWYVKVYIKRYYYAGEDHFITIKKGVFTPAEIHVQWQKIQDVYVDQDLLDRVMGLYDVHIASATAASGIEAHIDGVGKESADGLKKFLLDKVSGRSAAVMQQSAESSEVPTPGAAPKVASINLTEEISNSKYPLSGRWVTVSLIGRFFSSFSFTGLIIFILISKSNDTSIFTDNWALIVLGWLALGVLSMIVRTITLFLWKKNYAFNFTPENIYYREGVISLSEKHMPYSSIQDVTVKQGVVERVFGLASVVIENASQQPVVVGRNGKRLNFGGIVLQGLSLSDANKITEILKTNVLGRNSSKYGL